MTLGLVVAHVLRLSRAAFLAPAVRFSATTDIAAAGVRQRHCSRFVSVAGPFEGIEFHGLNWTPPLGGAITPPT